LHGITGAEKDTWALSKEPDKCWLPEAFPKSRIILYRYSTDCLNETWFTEAGIVAESLNLLKSLADLRDREPREQQKPLIFVSHDVGGAIVKSALIHAARNPNQYEHIFSSVRALIFFGYPHSPVNVTALQEKLAVAIMMDNEKPARWGTITPLTTSLARALVGINHRFCQTKLWLRAHFVNVYSDRPSKFFSMESCTMRIPFEKTVAVNTEHHAMALLDRDQAKVMGEFNTSDWTALDLGTDLNEAAHKLWYEASPAYQVSSPNTYLLLNSALRSELDSFSTKTTEGLLHIQCAAESEAVSTAIRDHLSDQWQVMSFPFSRHDVRFNNTNAMLRTFICSIAYHIHESDQNTVKGMLFRASGLASTELSSTLLAWKFVTNRSRSKKQIYILENLHECDSSSLELLSHLATTLAEREIQFLVVVTTQAGKDDHLTQSFDSFSPATYRKYVHQSDDNSQSQDCTEAKGTSQLNFASWLAKISPIAAYPSFEKAWQDSIHFEDLSSVISEWLQDQHEKVMGLIKRRQSQDVIPLFEDILHKIPADRHRWAKTILSFLTVSLRPLEVEELQLISSLAAADFSSPSAVVTQISRKDVWEGTKDIMTFFAGLITIQGTEVRFSHHLIREWLATGMQKDGPWWNLESAQKAHTTVARFCLSYVAAETEFNPSGLWPTAHSFPYGALYWPHHYMESKGDEQLESVAEKAFKTTKGTVRITSKLFDQSRFFDSIDSNSVRPLPVAAYFGFATLVTKIKDNHQDDKFIALIEAVKKGHSGIARELIDDIKDELYIDSAAMDMEKLIDAALLSGDALLRSLVVNAIQWKRRDIEAAAAPWLSMTLLKACWVGCENLTRRLLDAGADVGFVFSESDSVKYGPFSVACMSNSTGVLAALIDHAKAADFEWPTSGSLVAQAARWATEDTMKLLYDSGMKPDEPDEDGWSLILLCVDYRRHALLEFLLSSRPYKDYMARDTCITTPILFGAWHGMAKTVSVLLKHDADINSNDTDGNALFGAVHSGKVEVVEMLLKHGGIDVNFAAEGRRPPLLEAINNTGHKERDDIVRLLIKHKADPEIRDSGNFKRTALQLAVGENGYDMTEIIKILIAAGADLNARDENDDTPLILALELERPRSFIETLLQGGSDIYTLHPSTGFSPLHYARRSAEFVKAIVEHDEKADFTATYGATLSPLEAAMEKDIPEVVELMIKHSTKDATALNASLVRAAQFGFGDACRMIIEAGADVDARDKSKTSALSWATVAASDSAVRTILEYRPDMKSVDDFGRRCLHWIAPVTPVETVQRLINAGAELDVRDNEGITPLIEVVRMNNMAALKCLLKYPAARLTINILSKTSTALHAACRMMNKEALELLIEAQADVNVDGGNAIGTPIVWACLKNGKNYDEEKERMIRFLVEEKGASIVRAPTAESPQYSYPVHVAVGICSVPVIQLFLDRGARSQLYEADWLGCQGIHMACYNSLDAVKTLQAPAEAFTARDKFGRLPIHYAVLTGDLGLVKHVLGQMKEADRNLTINSTDHDGWTALHWVARATEVFGWLEEGRDLCSLDIIQYLVDEGADVSARAKVRPYGEAETASVETSWLASDIASYHGAEDIAKKFKALESQSDLKPTTAVKAPRKVGEKQTTGYCDGCGVRIFGLHLHCNTCSQLDWCFKCAGWREELPAHDASHENEWQGSETDLPEEEPVEAEVAREESEKPKPDQQATQADEHDNSKAFDEPPTSNVVDESKKDKSNPVSDDQSDDESDVVIIEEDSDEEGM
jgi:ankyrin repeat protein